MKIINIPIEPIPMRYSVDWQKWFLEYWGSKRITTLNIEGQQLTKGIERGRFLDCVGTNYYKSSQLMLILQFIHQGVIEDGDTLFFHDLWFPGIEQIKYSCDALNIELQFCGCLHAGSYDPNDFLYQAGMASWALHFENMLFEIVDKVFLATEFHRGLLTMGRTVHPSKLKVTGFPMRFNQMNFSGQGKENLIVFPHRQDPEKNVHIFKEVMEEVQKFAPEWDCIFTSELKTKADYYQALSRCKIAVSCSDQETWGIAMQECVGSGCIPLMPFKLSYPEMYKEQYLYTTQFDLLEKVKGYITKFDTGRYQKQGQMLWGQFEDLEKAGSEAFRQITQELINYDRHIY